MCKETWPTRSCLNSDSYRCYRCKRDKRSPRLLSAENDMDPGLVPLCLEGLTQVEQMLIARGCPVMCVYRKKGGQRGYKNHVLNFPQDIQGFLDSLPSYVSDLPFLVVRRMGQDNSHRDFKVRRTRVYDAVVWLRDNNRFYQDIHINMDAVSSLPEDGVPEELLTVEEQDDPDDPPTMPDSSVVYQIMTEIDEWRFSQDNAASGDRQDQQEQQQQPQQQQLQQQAVMLTEEDNLETMSEGDMFSRSDHDADDADDAEETPADMDTRSFIPLPLQQDREDTAIRSTINGQDPLAWPDVSGEPMSEFSVEGLASLCFPALFPYGRGDPMCKARRREVSLSEAFKHLIKYADLDTSGLIRWRFASDPRFPYWCLNIKQRHQLLGQAKIYIQQHPHDAHLTVEQLRAMVGTLSTDQLMKRVHRYAAKVSGTDQYWFQRYLELKSLLEQKGIPTCFWTVSSADTYWPQLHSLMPHSQTETISHSARTQAVVDIPHLTDWFFCNKLKDFVNHWLLQVLDAQYYWYRIEYQARGSAHAHGCARLKNDPGICSLVRLAAEGWLAEQELDAAEQTSTRSRQELQDKVDEGLQAKQTAIQYIDWLVTTVNPSPEDQRYSQGTHPSSIEFTDVSENEMDEDYQSLINTVQRHTRCSPIYCLRIKPGQQEPSCRFSYPRPEQQWTDIEFQQLPDGHVKATLITKRNDPRVNAHNRVILQHWRANTDLQPIVDTEAAARYLCKYAAKGERRSHDAHAILKSCVGQSDDLNDTRSVLRRFMLRAVGQRDFSAQETADANDLIHEDWRITKTHDYTVVLTARIIAVYSLTQYHACTKCNSKIPPPESDNDTDIACCPKCSTSQRFSLSPTHQTARLLVQLDFLGDTTTKTVQAFDTTIRQIGSTDCDRKKPVTANALLTADPFPCLLNNDVIVYHRQTPTSKTAED